MSAREWTVGKFVEKFTATQALRKGDPVFRAGACIGYAVEETNAGHIGFLLTPDAMRRLWLT